MEAKFGGKSHIFHGPVAPDLKAVGKKSMEWDLNDWKWDGDLFTATPINPVPSDCRSRQLFPAMGSKIPAPSNSDELNPVSGNNNNSRKRELEKRRRGLVVEDEGFIDEAGPGSLNLKLGGQVYPITEMEVENLGGKSGKKSKIVGTAATSNGAVCQVEDCRADLSSAKDYHRRHKVCDVHSKANRAIVGNVMQRFCQQCSRFHVLEEFDEGKRSCRRRLAGHNRRRRKTHPENVVNGSSMIDERGSNYLLISLLRILSNMHASSSDQANDPDLLSHLLKNIAGTNNGGNLPGFLSGSQYLQNAEMSLGTQAKDIQGLTGQCATVSASGRTQNEIFADDTHTGNLQLPSASQSNILIPTKGSSPLEANATEMARFTKLNNIDLNSVYDDSQDYIENLNRSCAPGDRQTESLDRPLWEHQQSHKSSPPQTSGNSGSTSTLSPSSSSGEAQSRTDRIVFKLFGKDPNDFPLVLRKQILDWLSHSPTDIESYIRPGCIVLTIYLRLDQSTWEQLYGDLSASLSKLLNASNDSFWRTGWVYARVRHRVAFTYNGQIVLDTTLPIQNHKRCVITSIKPIAISVSDRARFSVKGFNLSLPTTRLHCALEGKYLVQESGSDIIEGGDTFVGDDGIQHRSFFCSIPNITGRGFIEVEDHTLSSSFFPFIVAEQDVCSEICTLQNAIEEADISADEIHGESEKTQAKNQAMEFIHEMGWLLHRNQLKFRMGLANPKLELYPFKRFRWLMEFSIGHDWRAVVKKLLDILCNGTVDAGEHRSLKHALHEMGLLHRAVQRNCSSVVEALLSYAVSDGNLDESGSEHPDEDYVFLFRPDVSGPGGLTPLHLAASKDGSECVLDALTDDPGMVGIEAWKNARDSVGLTPNDYACLQGRYSYINLVQKKMNNNRKTASSGHVVVDIIPGLVADSKIMQKTAKVDAGTSTSTSFQTESRGKGGIQRDCKLCERKLAYVRAAGSSSSLAIYKPAMLSLVAIAAVCVCVALLFKSSPEVLYVFRPFRWELLEYGSS